MCIVALWGVSIWGGTYGGPTMALSFVIFPSRLIFCLVLYGIGPLVIWWSLEWSLITTQQPPGAMQF